jgi:hypothetical protein
MPKSSSAHKDRDSLAYQVADTGFFARASTRHVSDTEDVQACAAAERETALKLLRTVFEGLSKEGDSLELIAARGLKAAKPPSSQPAGTSPATLRRVPVGTCLIFEAPSQIAPGTSEWTAFTAKGEGPLVLNSEAIIDNLALGGLLSLAQPTGSS